MNGRKQDHLLSTTGQAIRARARKKHEKFHVDVDAYMTHVARKPIAEWDLEELARGKPRDEYGRLRGGAKPKWLTPVLQEEIKVRFRQEAFNGLAEHLPLALKVLSEMLASEETDIEGKPIVSAKDKIDIAKFIVEHVIGKAPQTLEIGAGPRYKEVLASSLVLDDGQPEHAVIDGDWEEVDDDGE